MRPDLRELSFSEVRKTLEQLARDGELEDAVAQKLEPFVRRPAVGRPGRVRENVLQALGREVGDQFLEACVTGAR